MKTIRIHWYKKLDHLVNGSGKWFKFKKLYTLERIAQEANKEWPELHHFIEERTERSFFNSML